MNGGFPPTTARKISCNIRTHQPSDLTPPCQPGHIQAKRLPTSSSYILLSCLAPAETVLAISADVHLWELVSAGSPLSPAHRMTRHSILPFGTVNHPEGTDFRRHAPQLLAIFRLLSSSTLDSPPQPLAICQDATQGRQYLGLDDHPVSHADKDRLHRTGMSRPPGEKCCTSMSKPCPARWAKPLSFVCTAEGCPADTWTSHLHSYERHLYEHDHSLAAGEATYLTTARKVRLVRELCRILKCFRDHFLRSKRLQFVTVNYPQGRDLRRHQGLRCSFKHCPCLLF